MTRSRILSWVAILGMTTSVAAYSQFHYPGTSQPGTGAETGAQPGTAASPTPNAGSQEDVTGLQTATSDVYGEYLVDSNGRALYIFDADNPSGIQAAGTQPEATASPSPTATPSPSGSPQAGETSSVQSTCYDECAVEWPPALVAQSSASADEESGEDTPVAGVDVSENISRDLLGTSARTDGSNQLTFNEWPLYYFADDQEESDVKGQGITNFGGTWYLISPTGEPIQQDAGQAGTPTTSLLH